MRRKAKIFIPLLRSEKLAEKNVFMFPITRPLRLKPSDLYLFSLTLENKNKNWHFFNSLVRKMFYLFDLFEVLQKYA